MIANAQAARVLPGASGFDFLSSRSIKCLKSLSILLLFGSAACTKSLPPPDNAARITALENRNAELEAELTVLREKSLSAKHGQIGCDSAENSEKHSSEPKLAKSSEPHPSREQKSGRPQLRIVRLGPDGQSTPDEDSFSQPVEFGSLMKSESAPVVAAPAAKAVEEKENTRPVLTVHGSREGRVYHRPLTASDRAESQGAAN